MFRIGNKENQRIHVEAISRHFFINDVIDEAEDYIDLIDALYQSQANENIFIHLNTQGGRLDITMQILNAIRVSDANVVGIADGEVASAGSLILFACPSIAIQPFSYVMLHDGGEGAGGKINENLKRAVFSDKLIRKIAHEVYGPFFTEEEIDSVLDGKDMWLSSEEVVERIKKIEEEEEEIAEE